MNFFRERTISQAASDLIQFDADSIRQIVSSQHSSIPDIWLADPDGYERSGRLLRDSDSPRMLAYSTKSQMLYATDGCNSCARSMPSNLGRVPTAELKEFADKNGLRLELLEKLVKLIPL